MNRADRFMQRSDQQRMRRGTADISLQDQEKYREDAGWKMTDAGYESYLENEATFNEQYSALKGELDESSATLSEFESQLQGASGQLAENKGAIEDITVDNAWKTAQEDFLPVRVTDGDNIEATYMLPRDVIDGLDTDAFTGKDGAYFGSWVDDGQFYNVDVDASGGQGKRGEELHQSLVDAELSVKSNFYQAVAGDTASAQQEAWESFDESSAAIEGGYADLTSAQDALAGQFSELEQAGSVRATEKDMLSADYDTKLANRQGLAAVQTEPSVSKYRNLAADNTSRFK